MPWPRQNMSIYEVAVISLLIMLLCKYNMLNNYAYDYREACNFDMGSLLLHITVVCIHPV